MHSDGDADLDIVFNALTIAKTFPMALFRRRNQPANSSFLALNSAISSPRALVIWIEKRLLISRSSSSYSLWPGTVNSWNTCLLWLWYHIKVAKVYFFCQVKRGRKLLISFVYRNNKRKCQDRLTTPSKLKLLDPPQMLRSSMCLRYIIRHIRVERWQCVSTLKMGLATHQTRNNADRNDQTSTNTRAVTK